MKAVFDPSMKRHLIEEFGAGSFSVQADGTLLFEHEYTDKDNLIAWMLTCKDKVTVLEPEDIRDELIRITENILKKYSL
ncbi:MAG: WYL domain-containing protein [Acetatifactor sp.]